MATLRRTALAAPGRCRDLAHTAILEWPLSTACVAGVLKGSDSRDVISVRRRRRFLRAPDEGLSSKRERGRLRRSVGAGGAAADDAAEGDGLLAGSGLKTSGVRRGSGREEKVKTPAGVPALRTMAVRLGSGTCGVMWQT